MRIDSESRAWESGVTLVYSVKASRSGTSHVSRFKAFDHVCKFYLDSAQAMLQSFALSRIMRVRRNRWHLISAIGIAAAVLCIWPLGDVPTVAELLAPKSSFAGEADGVRHHRALQPWDQSHTSLQADGSILARLFGRVLVTGGGGNIGGSSGSAEALTPGKHLIRRLLAAGVAVTSIDIMYVREELDEIYREVPEAHSLLRVVVGDIRDERLLQSAFTTDVVGVIHLAAVSRVLWCLENEPDCEDVNVRGVDCVLEAMRRSPVGPWFIQASSREVYGSATSFPVTEGSPLKAANVYGASKTRAEEVIHRHGAEPNTRAFQGIILRLSNVYGGEFDHRERLIPSIMTQAMSHRPIQVVGGHQDLDMIHIDDVIDSFILAANRLQRLQLRSRGLWGFFSGRASVVEVYNVASGASVPVSELLGKVLAVTQSSSPLQTISGDGRFPDRYVGSTEKASAILKFSPRIGLDEGIHRLATAYLRQTSDYLQRKIQEKCSRSPAYNANDLIKLDGCSGTVATYGQDHNGYLYFDGNADETFGWKDEEEPQTWRFVMDGTSSEDPVFQFWAGAEYFEVLGAGQMRGEGESRFMLRLDPPTGHIRLLSVSTGKPILADRTGGEQLFRLTPLCCPDKEGPWPFFDEDPLASAIFDLRGDQPHDLSASRPNTLCKRLQSAEHAAQMKLDRLESFERPITLEQAPLPTGSPSQWRLRDLPTCVNLCDHPTICVDTGSCMCAQSSCPSSCRFPFASSANLPILSYPSSTPDENQLLDPNVLKDQVKRSSWLNVLRPHAARYLGRSPPFMPINLTWLPDDWQSDRNQNAEAYDKLHSSPYGCFSADSALERGVKQISTEYSADGLVFLPHYAGTKWFPPVDTWLDQARQHYLSPSFDEVNLVIPFAHDFGPCNFWQRSLFEARTHAWPTRSVEKGSAWSVMGDLNVKCYRPDQDIVIPPRTCLQDRLREYFGGLEQVRPSGQRTNLAAFRGSEWGQGRTIRQRVTCPRPYQRFGGSKLERGTSMPSYWNEYPEGKDYVATLNDTVFCPLPPGVTGWSTRVVDVIYSGCIPVLIGDQTHHPFWDMLDWNKFSIQICEGDLDHLEEILLGYSWSKVQQLQTNLMLIRDAFLYPSEEDMEQHLRVRGPFFFAMHGTALLRQTKFPT